MSRFYPGQKPRSRRSRRSSNALAALIAVAGVLLIVATVLEAYPFPFSVPRWLWLLPDVSGFALVILALVLVLRGPQRLPRQ